MRRVLSFFGMLLFIALTLLLFWQVYLHRQATDPYRRDDTTLAAGKNFTRSELNHSEMKENGTWHA